MKNFNLLCPLVFLCIINQAMMSQNRTEFPDYIVTTEGDTVGGNIKKIKYSVQESSLVFKKGKDSIAKYRASDLQGFYKKGKGYFISKKVGSQTGIRSLPQTGDIFLRK